MASQVNLHRWTAPYPCKDCGNLNRFFNECGCDRRHPPVRTAAYYYHFTRTIHGVHWTFDVWCDGLALQYEFHRGPSPFWMLAQDGTSLDHGHGAHGAGLAASQVSRVQVLRFIACALSNLHGGGIYSNGNRPERPWRSWSPRQLRDLLKQPRRGKWVEFDCLDFRQQP